MSLLFEVEIEKNRKVIKTGTKAVYIFHSRKKRLYCFDGTLKLSPAPEKNFQLSKKGPCSTPASVTSPAHDPAFTGNKHHLCKMSKETVQLFN